MELRGIEKENRPEHKFKFNGVENEQTFGLNWNETELRSYDLQLGRWHQVDALVDTFTTYSPYHFVANNPINANDPKGDTIIYVNMTKSQQKVVAGEFNNIASSPAFKEVLEQLHKSKNVYKITIGKTYSNVPGHYQPNGNSTGGLITFRSQSTVKNQDVTVEEVFHAFQDDIKPKVYPNVSDSNIEFEAKLFKILVNQDMTGMTIPNGETGLQYVTNAINKSDPALVSNSKFSDADFSSKNLQSSKFSSFYQKAVQRFVSTWRSQSFKPKTYTASPSKDGPEAILFIQKQLKR